MTRLTLIGSKPKKRGMKCEALLITFTAVYNDGADSPLLNGEEKTTPDGVHRGVNVIPAPTHKTPNAKGRPKKNTIIDMSGGLLNETEPLIAEESRITCKPAESEESDTGEASTSEAIGIDVEAVKKHMIEYIESHAVEYDPDAQTQYLIPHQPSILACLGMVAAVCLYVGAFRLFLEGSHSEAE
eukprot:Blabericola_migrator_1__7441@NODE_3793_length_1507_cov_315_297917_g626_i2_p1_GENE_NODE_3793_length_1507_cov_315_297917_g626_i2NODE_3793_length_1507_cov_315_297917_g626_i2_p1_ORF_typecomplete_len185_score27_67Imm49/PF15575_6/0_26_NODE_3793_length_1507_cov_315_297917_g626_i2191745